MTSQKDRQHVVSALEKALRKDRTRTKISNISPLGLVEMTRKRTGETISEVMTENCPYCQGRGRVASPETVSINIERSLRRLTAEGDDEAFVVTAHPDVVIQLVGPMGETIEEIERRLRRAVYVRADEKLHVEKYEIVPGDMQETERHLVPHTAGETVECEVVRNPFSILPRSTAWLDGYLIDLANGGKYVGQRVKAKLTEVRRSYALGEVISSS